MFQVLADLAVPAASEVEIFSTAKDARGIAALVVLVVALELLRRRAPSADLREIEESRRSERAAVEETRRQETKDREATTRHIIDTLSSKPPKSPPP